MDDVTCVGMGSKLISKDILDNADFESLKRKVVDTLTLINTIKKGKQ